MLAWMSVVLVFVGTSIELGAGGNTCLVVRCFDFPLQQPCAWVLEVLASYPCTRIYEHGLSVALHGLPVDAGLDVR
eukprot:9360657-Karenia_brevis.AAC.1